MIPLDQPRRPPSYCLAAGRRNTPMTYSHAARRRRAAAAVELAILLPTVLVPLLLGIWEMGRIVEAQQILDNAAREGARQATTGKKTNSQVTQVVLQYLTNAGLATTDATNTVNVTVTVNDLTNPGTDAAAANQLD